jgi:hypothetical protein
MGARPYDPSLGRFYAVDRVDGGSLNSYDYCNQDPINCYDLNGLSSFWHKVGKIGEAVYGTADLVIIGGATFAVGSLCIAGAPETLGAILAICGPPTAAGIASTGLVAYKSYKEWEEALDALFGHPAKAKKGHHKQAKKK